jgi:hypothetical protein
MKPLDATPWEEGLLPEERLKKTLRLFLILGVLARAVRYFLRFPLWEDECFLAFNYIGRGYLDLLEPLEPHQVAPVLYLWAQLTVIKLLGYSELTLRLLAFLCGVASLFWFRNLADRLLKGTALLIAVALFAVAYPCLRYAAEAKPYGVDVLVSLVLTTLVVSWWQNPQRTRSLWVLTALLPLALGLSYAAVFVAGGISLVVAYTLWRSGERRGWIAWVAFNVVLCGSFAALVLLASNQSAAELLWMREYWHGAFPPVTRPLAAARCSAIRSAARGGQARWRFSASWWRSSSWRVAGSGGSSSWRWCRWSCISRPPRCSAIPTAPMPSSTSTWRRSTASSSGWAARQSCAGSDASGGARSCCSSLC